MLIRILIKFLVLSISLSCVASEYDCAIPADIIHKIDFENKLCDNYPGARTEIILGATEHCIFPNQDEATTTKKLAISIGRDSDRKVLNSLDSAASEKKQSKERLMVAFSESNIDLLYSFYEGPFKSKMEGNYTFSEGQCSISKLESIALHQYIQSTYSYINRYLRSMSSELIEYLPIIQSISSGIVKLTGYKGKVWRGLQLNEPQEFLKEHQIGSLVTYRSFTSTSNQPGWNWPGNIQYEIESRTGKVLKTSEQEVLFLPNSSFRITDVKEESGVYYIKMTDVTE